MRSQPNDAHSENTGEKSTPPRSDEVIRDKLAGIASAPDSESQGSLVDREGYQILLATFHNLSICRQFQAEMQREGTPSNRVANNGKYEVWVDEEDRAKASKHLAIFRESNPDVPSSDRRRRFDTTIFLAAIFGGLAFAFALSGRRRGYGFLLTSLRFVILGAVIGQVIDRSRQQEKSVVLLTFLVVTVFALLIWIVMSGSGFTNAPA